MIKTRLSGIVFLLWFAASYAMVRPDAFEPNNSFEQAACLAPMYMDTLALTLIPDDTDVFYINMEKNSTIIAEVTRAGMGVDTYMELYDSSRTLVAEDDDGGVGVNSMLTYSAADSGSHFLKIYNLAAGSNFYLLSVRMTFPPPDTLWTRQVAANASRTFSICEDGGYLVAGTVADSATGGDACLIRTDSTGTPLWSRAYTGGGFGFAYSLQMMGDGSNMVGGSGSVITGSGKDNKFFLMRTDTAGNESWTRIFGGFSDYNGIAVMNADDKGFLIMGSMGPSSYSSLGIWCIKTDMAGATLWKKAIGLEDTANFSGAVEVDGGYVIAGTCRRNRATRTDLLLMKIDASGTVLWTKVYGTADNDQCMSIRQTPDHGYIVLGRVPVPGSSGYPDNWILRTDSLGDTLWTRTFPVSSVSVVRPTADSGFALIGQSNGRIIIRRLDARGKTWWTKIFPADPTDKLWYSGIDIQVADNGDWIALATGYYYSYYHPDSSIFRTFLFRLKAKDYSYARLPEEVEKPLVRSAFSFNCHPNPFNPFTKISYQLDALTKVDLAIFNAKGEKVADLVQGFQRQGGHEIIFNARTIPSGVYFCRLVCGTRIRMRQIVLLK
jgi:hypothetical protein